MKNNLKTSLQRIISLIICFVLVLGYAPISEKAYADSFTVDFETSGLEFFTYSQSGGVEIKTSGGNKFMNISPTVDGITAVAGYVFNPKATLPVEISYDFMINKYMNNGTTVAAVTNEADQFLKIEVKDNAIAIKNSNGLYTNIVESCVPNKWYNIKLDMDFDNNLYSVYVDDVPVLIDETSLATYSYTAKEVKLSLSSKYSPGFAIDNFTVNDVQTTNRINVSGEKNIIIAEGESKKIDYTVKAYDSNDLEISGLEYNISLMPDDKGVSATLNENIITLDISADALAGEYSLYVISGKLVQVAKINISKYSPEITEMEILGDGKIAYGYNDNAYPFSVKLTDQRGNILNEGEIYYSLEGDVPSEIQLDSQTGVITVSGELPKDHEIVLKARAVQYPDVTSEKDIVLTDGATYAQDKKVFDVVLNHIENIWKYAQDPYNGTPLLALAIDRLTLEPARWPCTPDFDYVPSNMAAYSQLFRASDTIYMLTGEEKYRKRVDDANLYFLENFTGPNGLPFWGGHEAVNLETLEHKRTNKYVHELKGHDPYMDSFYRVDPKWAEDFSKTFFIQHIYDWNTMDMNRHGQYSNPTDLGVFLKETENYTPMPEGIGYSPVYTTNLGFSSSLYGFSRIATDLYKFTNDEHAANAFMRINEAFWKVASPDPDMWLDVPQNTTAGRKGYPDEAKEGLWDITYGPEGQPGKWWLLDPVPSMLQHTRYGDRYWKARGDDMIDQGFITEENQWACRECYIIEGMQVNPPYIYWEFVDAIGEDHPYADIVIERAVRNVANFIRMAYNPSNNTIDRILIDGTKLTGFVCKRAGYYGGIGQVYGQMTPGTNMFPSVALNYSRALKYPQYKEQTDIMWKFLKNYAEENELGTLGENAAGDAGMDLNLACSKDSRDYILGLLYLYDATDKIEFLDLARVIAQNLIENYVIPEGFIVDNTSIGNIFVGGAPSNSVYILVMLEAATRGEFDKCPAYVEHTGYREEELYLESLGEWRDQGNEFNIWEVPMPSVNVKRVTLSAEEIELKVGENYDLECTVYPDDAGDKSVYVSSSDYGCVAVNNEGKSIQAIKPGTVEITVRSVNNIMAKDKLKVTVVE